MADPMFELNLELSASTSACVNVVMNSARTCCTYGNVASIKPSISVRADRGKKCNACQASFSHLVVPMSIQGT
eukprot:300676-Amphidinium_carterae.2